MNSLFTSPESGGGMARLNASTQEARLVAHSSPRGSEPETYTLDFGVRVSESLLPVQASVRPRLQAMVQWGSAKGHSAAVIDLRQGARMTVGGISVTIDVSLWGWDQNSAGVWVPSPQGARNPPEDVFVWVSGGIGTFGTKKPNTYTPNELQLQNGVSGQFRVPPFASGFRALPSSGNVSVLAEFYAADPATGRLQYSAPNAVVPAFVPLPASARYVEVTPQFLGGGPIFLGAQFELSV